MMITLSFGDAVALVIGTVMVVGYLMLLAAAHVARKKR